MNQFTQTRNDQTDMHLNNNKKGVNSLVPRVSAHTHHIIKNAQCKCRNQENENSCIVAYLQSEPNTLM